MAKKAQKITKKIKFLIGAIIIGFLTYLEETYPIMEIVFDTICAIN